MEYMEYDRRDSKSVKTYGVVWSENFQTLTFIIKQKAFMAFLHLHWNNTSYYSGYAPINFDTGVYKLKWQHCRCFQSDAYSNAM